ncbi:MAG TPA: alpha/beta hydrolase [Candidatus Limnocylindrales bacterium]|nr:alpha/beta hydrolase [Candidatus Limnocylindrales bacterium]
MTDERIHGTVSADGTEIAGRVQGQGPPLVLVHGGIGDGEVAWEALLPYISERFTCYLPSTRGRGLSSNNPDHSPPRLEEDVAAFVDSIGEPVCLVGWSGSGPWVLGAAARSGSVAAVAAYEPFVLSVMRDDDLARTSATMEQVGMAAADGRLVDAIRAFAQWICTNHEIAALEKTDFYERWAGCVPAMLGFVQQDASFAGPRSTDPEALGIVTAPVLILRGRQTLLGTFFAEAARHIAQRVSDPHVRELPGVGHFAPLLAPQPLARELIRFFESVRQEPTQQESVGRPA